VTVKTANPDRLNSLGSIQINSRQGSQRFLPEQSQIAQRDGKIRSIRDFVGTIAIVPVYQSTLRI
jgi:hypothetical protein